MTKHVHDRIGQKNGVPQLCKFWHTKSNKTFIDYLTISFTLST